MREVRLAGHRVRLYDSIDELPIVRFHRYNRYLLVDAGVGSDISDFDAHMERAVRYLRNGDGDSAAKELENIRQGVYMILEGQNVRHLSFACLVESIDGKPTDDLSAEGLQRVLDLLGGAKKKDVTEAYTSVKKKIEDELSLYFPYIFDDTRTREYYDDMKRMTVEMLRQITDGETDERTKRIETLRDRLLLSAKPKTFTGHDGLEVRHDKDFETLCLTITRETGVEAKRMTVMEYYNAYEYLRRREKESQKRAN